MLHKRPKLSWPRVSCRSAIHAHSFNLAVWHLKISVLFPKGPGSHPVRASRQSSSPHMGLCERIFVVGVCLLAYCCCCCCWTVMRREPGARMMLLPHLLIQLCAVGLRAAAACAAGPGTAAAAQQLRTDVFQLCASGPSFTSLVYCFIEFPLNCY